MRHPLSCAQVRLHVADSSAILQARSICNVPLNINAMINDDLCLIFIYFHQQINNILNNILGRLLLADHHVNAL